MFPGGEIGKAVIFNESPAFTGFQVAIADFKYFFRMLAIGFDKINDIFHPERRAFMVRVAEHGLKLKRISDGQCFFVCAESRSVKINVIVVAEER